METDGGSRRGLVKSTAEHVTDEGRGFSADLRAALVLQLRLGADGLFELGTRAGTSSVGQREDRRATPLASN